MSQRCGDCAHFARCEFLFSQSVEATDCDWVPSRFTHERTDIKMDECDELEQAEREELIRTAVARRCAMIASELAQVHSVAYGKADLARNEDAMTFIAGLRDGATGVSDQIRREYLLGSTTPKSYGTASTTHENPKSDKLTSCPTDSD